MLRKLSEQDYYQILEVDYRATAEEIRSAYLDARDIYSPDSLVSTSILSTSERRKIFRHITEAYNTLIAEESRRQYDRLLAERAPALKDVLSTEPKTRRSGTNGSTSARQADYPRLVRGSASSDKITLHPDVELGSKEEATGSFLRKARESLGLDLRAIAEETKIGISMLRYIEQERIDSLPAPVYLRNFVSQVARCLGLDEEKVTRTYLARIRRLQSG
jgi:curved DNA-binding protein CbpA